MLVSDSAHYADREKPGAKSPPVALAVLKFSEMVQEHAEGVWHLQAKKRRKNVERRASKGRKLRYQVMEKLVHFMTPVPRAETTLQPQVFSALFNQPRPADGAE